MLKIFNKKHEQVNVIENPISPIVLDTLNTIGEFSFSLPTKQASTIELEGYVQVEGGYEYVVKEKVKHGQNTEIVCMLNIEEITGMARVSFISKENNVTDTATLILSGTGWRVNNKSTKTETRNLYGRITNAYNLLILLGTLFDVEVMYDIPKKEVTIVDRVGEDRGAYFMSDLNLKQVTHDTHTHKYITRVIPIGKDGLTIEKVNGGKDYLENTTYSSKQICGIWQSDKHDDAQKLKEDAQRFLDEMAVPYETYEVRVEDLYRVRGKEVFKYSVGDVVTIIDAETDTKVEQRIIQREYDLLDPTKDTIRIANKGMTFQEYYKRLQVIADMTESVIQSDGTINKDVLPPLGDGDFELGFDSITGNHIQAESIYTKHLVADAITADKIMADSIDTRHLKADIIQAEHIQAGAITAGSGIIADGAIGNAQISNLDAGKLSAGTIDTSKLTIAGANSNLLLRGNRLQVFEGLGNQQVERVALGDVNNDGTVFGFRVRGKDGQTILLDENGVKSEGITDGSITNDKISGEANIDGAKLDINSVVRKINEDGTEVIQGTKVEIGGAKLDVKLSEMTSKQDEDSNRITQNTANISANTESIKLKVDTQIYESEKDGLEQAITKNTSAIEVLDSSIGLRVEESIAKVGIGANNYINNSGSFDTTEFWVGGATIENKELVTSSTTLTNTTDILLKGDSTYVFSATIKLPTDFEMNETNLLSYITKGGGI